ncbi:MAG: ATP-binding cassette domain-containing protein [Bacteroidia bacterium]
MSEEILRALMQLFAIIANQDDGSGDFHAAYVQKFLASQISGARMGEFEAEYRSHLKEKASGETEKPKLTSMKDSVRTLSICKKINKTLNQKQKIIVFARLLEFIEQEQGTSQLRKEILKTVSEVFNISQEEYSEIQLLLSDEKLAYTERFLVIASSLPETSGNKKIEVQGFHGSCVFLYLTGSNLILCKYSGDAEIYLNGLVITPGQLYVFSPGSTVRHSKGTIFYSEVINCFLNERFSESVELNAIITEHRHSNGKLALQGISINENSGSLIGIMGASGSGKTTLLNVLSGNDRLTNGTITINGEKVDHENKKLHGVIGFIPQDDLLIEELTVFQNLFFSAKLCFKDISEQQLNSKVAKLLNSLGLYEVRDITVGNPLNKKISGGQRKRLNIALELIREPQVLFVDEPTSGLSSKDSENVMDLLKELSQKGKLIFVVIHQPSSDIYKLFDRIFFLDVGGFPVYYGNPIEAVMYFKLHTNQINSEVGECHSCGSVNPELIFNLLESKEIDEYGNYTTKRKRNPADWFELYKKFRPTDGLVKDKTAGGLKTLVLPGKYFQWTIFFKRDLLSKMYNKQYLLINILEVPALALLLSFLIRFFNKNAAGASYSYYNNDNIPAYFFMSILVALLVGLTVSAEEIYRDQKILKREQFLKLSRLSYLFSKLAILFTLSLIQSVLLCVIGNLVLEVPGNPLNFCLMVFSVFCSANIAGLILSSTFNSPVTIYIIIPLIIIPQMLLGGAMFRYSKLNPFFGGDAHVAPAVSSFMISRWAYEGIAVSQFRENKFSRQVYFYNKAESNLNYRISYVFPKLEEMKEILETRDSILKPGEKKFLRDFMQKEISSEILFAKNKYGPVGLDGKSDTLSVLKSFYADLYNSVSEKKDSMIRQLKKLEITPEKYTNKSLDEIVRNKLEKEALCLDMNAGKFFQIIDPIFQQAEGKLAGLDAQMFVATKRIAGSFEIGTYYYNLLVIWLMNIIGFVTLYFDLLRKLLAFPSRFNTQKIKYE